MAEQQPPCFTKDPAEREWFFKKLADFEAIGMQWIGGSIAGFMSRDGKVWGGYYENFDRQTKEEWPEYLDFYRNLIHKNEDEN